MLTIKRLSFKQPTWKPCGFSIIFEASRSFKKEEWKTGCKGIRILQFYSIYLPRHKSDKDSPYRAATPKLFEKLQNALTQHEIPFQITDTLLRNEGEIFHY